MCIWCAETRRSWLFCFLCPHIGGMKWKLRWFCYPKISSRSFIFIETSSTIIFLLFVMLSTSYSRNFHSLSPVLGFFHLPASVETHQKYTNRLFFFPQEKKKNFVHLLCYIISYIFQNECAHFSGIVFIRSVIDSRLSIFRCLFLSLSHFISLAL